MKKKTIKIKQKIGLIILGIILALVLLELSLRVGGYVMMSKQRANNVIEADDEYVILCLGESTTADMFNNQSTWPNELESLLNQKSPNRKFKVINGGMIGIISTEILESLEENLEKYKPDIVITMMGINDGWTRVNYDYSSKTKSIKFLNDLKTYKLGKLLFLHWSKKIGNFYEKNIKNKKEISKSYQEYIDLGWEYNKQEKYEESKEMFKKAIELDPKDPTAYSGLGWSYRNQLNVEKAEEAFNKSIELYPKNDGAYEGLAWVYNEKGKPKLAESMLKKAIEINPNNSMTYVELGVLYKNQGEFDEAKETLKKAVEINPTNERAYKILEEVYRNLSMNKEANDIYEKILEIRMNYYNPILFNNYQELYKILNKAGVKLVVMQYPLREIQEFKNFFDEEQQKDIIFVSNKENFEKALENASFEDYFIDMFAGDFGHCTVKGNRLIAENVAEVILEELKMIR